MAKAKLQVRTEFGDQMPRVRDTDLAEYLGYGRVRDIRYLIRQLFLGRVIETTPDNYKRGPGRPARFFWLTFEQARRVVGRSGATDTRPALEALEEAFAGRHAPLATPTDSPLTPSESTVSDVGGTLEAQRQKATEWRAWRETQIVKQDQTIELLSRIVELLQAPA